jgi:uncharacterized SAM-binding protein YcdF (DUF218 family)
MTGQRRRRWVLWAGLVALLVSVLFVTASLRLFVWPPSGTPAKVDAIVSLAGNKNRLSTALALARHGYARTVLVSVVPGQGEPCPPSTSVIRVICFNPKPATTRGEARFVGHVAAIHHWHRLIIVPGRSQVTRAEILFKRCYSGQLLVIPAHGPAGDVVYNVLYEWGATIKAMVTIGC